MKIEGKVALVTGGASGIGKALTERLLQREVKFVAVVDCAEEEAIATVSEFSRKYGTDRIRFFKCDVTDENELRSSFQETLDAYGGLDIVVNNAGIISKDNLKTVNVNLVPVMNGMIIANELMSKTKRSEKGVIINTSSLTGFKAYPEASFGYIASKHGIHGLTKAFQCSSDGFSKDLRAVAICPGVVDTAVTWRCNFLTQEEGQQRQEDFDGRHLFISMSSVIDAYVQAIEDDTLSGAFIKVELSGNTVTYDEQTV